MQIILLPWKNQITPEHRESLPTTRAPEEILEMLFPAHSTPSVLKENLGVKISPTLRIFGENQTILVLKTIGSLQTPGGSLITQVLMVTILTL